MTFSNNQGAQNVTIVDVILSGDDASDFSITVPHTNVFINSMGMYQIWIDFSPTTIGYKYAHATMQYKIGTGPIQTFDVVLTGLSVGADNDGDGLSYTDETRELLPGEPNPFNPAINDSTGDSGYESPDGFPDGLNDWDGDGMNNQDEFLLGYNPCLASSHGHPTESDRDGDGISDIDETRLLWGMPNPFDPCIGDSTGNNWQDTPDGYPDGINDYDGDGFTNAYEFQHGMNPLVADIGVHIPLSSLFGRWILLVLILGIGVARFVKPRAA